MKIARIESNAQGIGVDYEIARNPLLEFNETALSLRQRFAPDGPFKVFYSKGNHFHVIRLSTRQPTQQWLLPVQVHSQAGQEQSTLQSLHLCEVGFLAL
jgi:hypothetical protein